MFDHVPCPYCLELPPLDKARKGEIHRCPLCKTEILKTGAGTSYRLRTDDGEEIHVAEHAGWGRWLSSLFAGSSVLLVALGALGWRLSLQRADLPSVQPASADRVEPRQEAAIPPEWRGQAKNDYPNVFFFAKPHGAMKGTAKNRGVQLVSATAKAGSPLGAAQKKEFEPASELAAFNFHKLPIPEVVTMGKMPVTSASTLQAKLSSVPELALEEASKEPLSSKQQFARMSDQVKTITEQNKNEADGFIKNLQANRADLAGLPFLLSPACQLSKEKAAALQYSSRAIRDGLDDARRPSSLRQPWPSDRSMETLFWKGWSLDKGKLHERVRVGKEDVNIKGDTRDVTLPALAQIVAGEDAAMGHGFVNYLEKFDGPAATKLLVKQAMFSLEHQVRRAAVKALKDYPRSDYSRELLDGLAHPWAPAASHAAAALVELDRKDLVPEMIKLLAAPDPAAPIALNQALAVREMVRINHHKNCFLCHAPAGGADAAAVALVPNPALPLPSSSRVYYDRRDGSPAVRADITYLRQDFSVKLPVADAGPWPQMQRFDFFVRVRAMTASEQQRWQAEQAAGGQKSPSEQRQALLFALRELTGRDGGDSAEVWRGLLPAPRTERTWKSSCLK